MQSDILFDNIYIGHSIEDAKTLQEQTFDIKRPIEIEEEKLSAPPPPKDSPKSPLDLVFMEDPVRYVHEKVDLFIAIARNNPMEAIKFVPEVAGGIGALLVTLIALVVGIISMSSSTPPPQVKKAAETVKDNATEAKDKTGDAASSGAEAIKTEAVRRSNRRAE
jgi:calnexin